MEVLDNDFERSIRVDLDPLPGKITILSDPDGADVTLNGVRVGKTTPISSYELPPGEIQLSISKEGYISQTIGITVGPQEKKLLPIIRMVPLSEIEARELDRENRFNNEPWVVGAFLGLVGSTTKAGPSAPYWQLGGSLEKWVSRTFGLRFDAYWTTGGSSTQDPQQSFDKNGNIITVQNVSQDGSFPYSISGFEVGFSLPISLYRGPLVFGSLGTDTFNVFLSPDVGILSQRYTGLSYATGSTRGVSTFSQANDISFTQAQIGCSLGFEFYVAHKSALGFQARVGIHQYLQRSDGNPGQLVPQGQLGLVYNF